MKNLFKVFGMQSLRLCAIALVAVIGFSFVACDNGTTSGDDGADLKSKMVTFTIQNDTNKDGENQSGRSPVKMTGVKVYFYPENNHTNPESYLIGEADTFDTTLIAEAGASITIPAVKVSQYDVYGRVGYPSVYVEVSIEGITDTSWTYETLDSSTSDETFNEELVRGFPSGTISLSEVE